MTKIYTYILTIFFIFTSASFAYINMMIGSKGNLSEVVNAGNLVHEFNIANAMMHKKHQPEMEKMVENEILLADSIDREKMKKMAKMDKAMGHSHSNSVLLAPNEKGDLVWKFDNAMNIEIACNVPGHYQIGMVANVDLK